MPYVRQFNYKELVAKHGKRCAACGQKKKAVEFNNNRNRHDGKQAYCRKCQNSGKLLEQRRAYSRSERRRQNASLWREENRQKLRKYYRQYRETKRLRESMALDDKFYAGVV